MRRSRVSIAGLMAVVLFASIGCAALFRPSRLWAAVLMTGAVGLLVVAIIGAAHGRGPRRAFWSGFAIAGWAYILIHYGPWLSSQGPHLLPNALIELLHASIKPPP